MDSMVFKQDAVSTSALNLLTEVCDICEKNKLSYYLAPKMVLRALRELDYETFFTIPEIYLFLDDAVKFINIVEADMPESRSLDYLRNNKNYSSFNLSYVNTDTTCINMGRGEEFSQHGLKVTINIIRNDSKERLPGIVETGRESNAFRAHGRWNWKKRIGEAVVGRAISSDASGYNIKLFEYYVSHYQNNPDSEKVFVRRFRKRRMYFDRKLFDERSTIELGGRSFYTVKDVNEFLACAYGKEVDEIELTPYKRKHLLISTSIPFESYMSRLNEQGVPLEKIFEQQNNIRKSNIANSNLIRSVNRVFLLARLSEQRMIQYAELNKQIEEIRSLYKNGDFDRLRVIFKEYDQQTRYFLRRNYCLCPSEELFEIECALLEQEGLHSKVKDLRKLLFKEHKKPLMTRQTEED